jgi:hypothetical protein
MSPSPSKDHPDFPPFEVRLYSIDALIDILSGYSEATRQDVEAKLHCIYFRDYFASRDIKAQTILVENNYIDRDYLEDFAEYYIRCFRHYRKKSTRLHFFDISFTVEEFESLLRGENQKLAEAMQDGHYLGFVVVKPLPETIIGRTCLKVYGKDKGRRHYLGITPYKVTLFGLELEVDSLAFQEQDSVLAACATSALWSIFQVTGKMFQHAIPSPSAITKSAAKYAPMDNRYFPNNGLSAFQIASAVRSLGLEPSKVDPGSRFIFKSTLYAYLRSGLPVLLGMALYDISNKSPRYLGLHAVAVTGYSLGHPKAMLEEPTDILLEASRIDKIYVHDDQVGPFARMELETAEIGGNNRFCLSTSWKDQNGELKGVKAVPEIFVIPLYHKIRIPFEKVLAAVRALVFILEAPFNKYAMYPKGLTWDIRLTCVNDLKNELLKTKPISEENLRAALLQEMPRFIWRATACHGKDRVIDLLFDATDIEQASFLSYAIDYDNMLFEILKILSGESWLRNHPSYHAAKKIFHWFSTLH